MTREQKIKNARELRAQGLTYAETADYLGGSISTVYRWLNPERTAPYRNGRAIDPERARAYDREYRRNLRINCPQCAGPMKPESTLCQPCHEDEVDRRARQIERWWAEGLTMAGICERLGWTMGHLAVEFHRLREKGYDLPYRYVEGKRAGHKFPDQVAA